MITPEPHPDSCDCLQCCRDRLHHRHDEDLTVTDVVDKYARAFALRDAIEFMEWQQFLTRKKQDADKR